MSAFSMGFYAGASPQRSRVKAVPKVDIEAVTDSALILADNYADALSQKPEFARTRLNALRKFYERQPAVAQDSVRERLYDFMSGYMEDEREKRFNAFMDCFMAIAPENDLRLGPLYAMQLTQARERFDTIATKKFLPLLDEYARRMDFDYDEDLRKAEKFLDFMRTKPPINESLVGVWVGENICRRLDDKYIQHPYKEGYVGIGGDMDDVRALATMHNIMVIYPNGIYPLGTTVPFCDLHRIGYEVPSEVIDRIKKDENRMGYRLSEVIGGLKKEKYKSFLNQIHGCFMFPGSKEKVEASIRSRFTEYHEDYRSVYAFWSSEYIDSFDPVFIGNARQRLQANAAKAAGNLARKKVSTSKKLWGGAMVNGLNRMGNTILDQLAVSTAIFWAKEMTIFQENPCKLTADLYVEVNRSKSNSGAIRKFDKEFEGMGYYLWEPSDDVFFIDIFSAHSSIKFITLGELDGTRKKELKRRLEEAKKKYETIFGKINNNIFNFKGDGNRPFLSWFNTEMFNKLKAKAKKYEKENGYN